MYKRFLLFHNLLTLGSGQGEEYHKSDFFQKEALPPGLKAEDNCCPMSLQSLIPGTLKRVFKKFTQAGIPSKQIQDCILYRSMHY